MKNVHYLFCLLLLPFVGITQITVTNTADDGPGSLRQALSDANADPDLDNIFFNINGGGAHTISIISDLPSITDDGITIDATTQPGYVNSPLITIDGNGIEFQGFGFFSVDNCSLIGLKIVNFGFYGVVADDCNNLSIFDNIITENDSNQIILSSSSNCLIVFNILGLDENGIPSAIDATGLRLQAGSADNYISENTIGGVNNIDQPLVYISQVESSYNTIENNYIGTNADGDNYGSAAQAGILIQEAPFTNITGNIIAYNSIGIWNTAGASNNFFSANSFSCNINSGILNEFGSNDNIQPPTITQATTNAVEGTANPGFIVQIYLQDAVACPGTACQGYYVDEVFTDSNGGWVFFPTGIPIGAVLTAIQIDPTIEGHTSAFSGCATLVIPCGLDTEAPTISGIPMDVSIGCNDAYPDTDVLFANITAFDNVDGDLTEQISQIPPGFVFGCIPGPTRAEEYIFSVSDACGNMATETFTVTILNDVNVDLGPDRAICNNEFVTLNAGNPGLAYEWSTGETTQTIEVNEENTYSVTVTGGNGCCAIDEIIVSEGAAPNVTAMGGTINCINTSVTLMANSTTPGVTYLWTSPTGDMVTEQNPDTDEDGIYTLQVTAPNGCTASTTVIVIDETTPPNVTAMGTTINCGPGPFFITASSTTPGVTYLWTDEEGETSTDQNTEVFGDGDAMNSGIVTLVVTAPNGCTTTTTIEVTEDTTAPDITATGGTLTCENSSISLMASSTTPGVTYRWTYPNGLNSTVQNPEVNLEGTYIVEATAPNGCTAMTTVTVLDDIALAPMSNFTFSITDLMASFTDNSTNMPTNWFWDFGDRNTATGQNPTYSYLTPGTYTVCLTASNDCGADTTCETITVNTASTDILTFSIGSVTGQSGTIIQIPVSVEHFTNIVSFQKSIHVSDPTIARLVGVSDFNLDELDITDFNFASDDTFTVAWFNTDGISIPDGTVIYMLNIELLATIETCTEVFIDGNPTIIEAADIDANGFVSAVPYLLKSGEACVLPKVDVFGSVFRKNGDALEDVMVECTTVPADNTDAFGEYEFLGLGAGLDYTVTPTRNTDHKDGVTAIDLALIQRHVLNIQLLNSPYKLIAADVDTSGLVSGIDLVKIQQLILNITTEFPDFNSWRFVDEKFLFTDDANPFLDDFPEDIELLSLGRDTFDNDFITMKLGDVNDSAMGLQGPDEGDLNMLIAETINPDRSRTIEFRSADNTAISAYQFDIQFDQYQMSLLEVIPGTLPGLNSTFFGMDNTDEGLITTLWYDPTATEGGWELQQEEVLFSLRFEAPAVVSAIEDRIQTGVATMKSAGYKHNGDALTIKTSYESFATGVEDLPADQLIGQLSVSPTPFQNETSISFTLGTASIVDIQVYDATGKAVQTMQQHLGAGAQQIRITNHDLNGVAGLYYVKLQVGDYVATRKVVLLN